MSRRGELNPFTDSILEKVVGYLTLSVALQFWPIWFLGSWYLIVYLSVLAILIGVVAFLFVRRRWFTDELRHYVVVWEGRGIRLPRQQGSELAVGFTATSIVAAASADEAINAAQFEVLSRWHGDGWAKSNLGSEPDLVLKSVVQTKALGSVHSYPQPIEFRFYSGK